MKNNRMVALVVVGVLLIIAMISYNVFHPSPTKVVERYFAALKAGDTNGAIECFDPMLQSQFKGAYSFSDMLFGFDSASVFDAFSGLANDKAYMDYDFRVSGETMTERSTVIVNVDIYVRGTKVSTTAVECRKYNEKWYICG